MLRLALLPLDLLEIRDLIVHGRYGDLICWQRLRLFALTSFHLTTDLLQISEDFIGRLALYF